MPCQTDPSNTLPPPLVASQSEKDLHTLTLMTKSSSTTFPRKKETAWKSCFQPSLTTTTPAPPPANAHKPESSSRVIRRKSSSEIDLASLRFDKDKLYGREREVELLRREYYKANRPVIFVSGPSGVGKSALVETLQGPAKYDGGIYALGKYDFQQKALPYPGITQACRRICQHFLEIPLSEERKDELRQALGTSVQTLTTVLPQLVEFMGVHNDPANGQANDQDEEENEEGRLDGRGQGRLSEAQNRFHYAMASFLGVATSWSTVVMVLDDLQWADAESIKLLEALLSDSKLKGLVLVCCYRSNEIDQNRVASQWIRDVEQQHVPAANKDGKLSLTKLSLTNLDEDAVNQMLADALRTDTDETTALALIVHRKTLGNPFFVIQYLRLLQDMGLLTFSFGLIKWVWSLEEIEANTKSTDNVVDLMQAAMIQLPNELSEILPLAACLGATFLARTLSVVVDVFQQERKEEQQERPIETGSNFWLQVCVEKGFIVKATDGGDSDKYCWVHDKVQEAALGLVKTDQLETVQFRVGEILVDKLTVEEVDENIFVVVNLLNKGTTEGMGTTSRLRSRQLAQLNLKAGHAAMASASFKHAALYLAAGIRQLQHITTCWETDYDLSLDLFSSAAESEFASGNIDKAEEMCRVVVESTNHPILDKFRAYDVLIPITWGKQDFGVAEEMAIHVLREMGCRFPRMGKIFVVASGLLGLKRAFKRLDQLSCATQSRLTDKAKILSMRLLDRLVTISYYRGSLYLPLSILKSYHWSIKYGISEYSPSAFALVAMVVMGTVKDFDAARSYAEFALQLLESDPPKFEGIKSRTIFVTHCFVLHAFLPHDTCLKAFVQGYESGLATGDVENACQNILIYLDFTFFAGRNLRSLDHDCAIYGNQLKSFSMLVMYSIILMRWQVIRNLLGNSENPHLLIGDVFDVSKFESNERTTVVAIYQDTIDLAYFMCDDVIGAEQASKLHREYNHDAMNPGSRHYDNLLAHTAVVCYSAVRKSGNRKYLPLAKRCHKHVKEISKKGNFNYQYSERLLDAEVAALRGCKQLAKTNYQRAIAYAARSGMVNEQAVVNERFADYMFESNDTNESTYHWNMAIDLYKEWGAVAKVDQIGEKLKSTTAQH